MKHGKSSCIHFPLNQFIDFYDFYGPQAVETCELANWVPYMDGGGFGNAIPAMWS
jgi:hypothetical protein